MRIFTVVCMRDQLPYIKYVRFLLVTEKDYKPNSKKLYNAAVKRHAELVKSGFLPPSHVVWIDTGAHEALAPQV